MKLIYFAIYISLISHIFNCHSMDLNNDAYYNALDYEDDDELDYYNDNTFPSDHSDFTVYFDAFGPDSYDYVQTTPSNDSSHAWDPMPNQIESAFDDSIRQNTEQGMQGWQQDLQNNYEYSQNHPQETSNVELPKEAMETQAPTPPTIPLWDTIGSTENLVKSEEGKQLLDARIEQLKDQTSGIFSLASKELKKELNFLEKVQSGEVSQLMILVQGGQITQACWTFEQLCKIWPYKHQAHFLVSRGYHSGEDRLVRLLGRVDLMKQVEVTLVSRPDYLALSPEAQYRFTHYKKEYIANQQHGNVAFLNKEFNHLYKLLHSKEYRDDKATLAQYLYLKLMLADPITNINATVAHGPQKKAIQEIRSLSHQIDFYFAKNNITDPEVKYAHMIESGMLEKYNNVQRLLEARPDFAQIMESGLIKGSYSVMEVGKALRENSDLLAICQQYEFQHTGHLKTRIDQLEKIKFGPSTAVYQEYNIAPKICSFMLDHGLKAQDYRYCYGDRLAQALHQEHLNIIEQTAALDPSSVTYAYTDCILSMVDAARELNQAGEPLKAMNVSDVCWTIFECGTAICEGIVQGAVGAIIDIIDHPISTAATLAFAPQLLAYQISKVALDLADIGLTSLMDKDLGKQKWDDYIKPLNDCINIITSSEVALQDKLRLGASITTQLLVQRKVLNGLGKFYNITKARAVEFVKNNPMATPEQYLVTADGRMLRAGNEPHNNNLNLRKGNGNGGGSGNRNQNKLETNNSNVKWIDHGWKHKPPRNMPWKKIVESTATGPAKYKPEINIKQLELHAWENGAFVSNGKNYKVFKCKDIIGAKWGKETQYIRVECSSNKIHGHPISEQEYLRYIK